MTSAGYPALIAKLPRVSRFYERVRVSNNETRLERLREKVIGKQTARGEKNCCPGLNKSVSTGRDTELSISFNILYK